MKKITIVNPNILNKPPYAVFWNNDILTTLNGLSVPVVYDDKGSPLTTIEISLDTDIKKAVSEKRLDRRSFQGNQAELEGEWNEKAEGNPKKYLENAKAYHIERISYFVSESKHLEEHPIHVFPDKIHIIDGLHRAWAAVYLNKTEIKAYIFENKLESDEWYKKVLRSVQ